MMTRTAESAADAEQMDAWRIHQFGDPSVLTPERIPIPTPTGDEVLIQVAHCGVCRHDLLTREGAFPNVSLPLTLGHQVSGVVVSAGPEATWEPGARLMSLIFMGCGHCAACRAGNQAVCQTERALFMGDDFDGGYAEYICTPSRAFIRVPDELPLDIAAVVNCTLGTAYHAAHSRGNVRAGDTVLVTGASGGIGLHAISVLKQARARVIAVTSRASQSDALTAHGADEVIADPELRFAPRVKELTDGIGADLVLEIVGTPTLAQSLHAVRTGGRVVVIGNVSGIPAEVRPAHLIMKEIALLGTKSCTEAELREVMRLVAAGELSVEISKHVPLHQVAAAHAEMHSQTGGGRIVLDLATETIPHSGAAR